MVKVLSYGGGLDSFAMLLLAKQTGELPDAVVFMDVGDGDAVEDGVDPGEWPGTYKHIREVAMPICAELGIPFHWLSSKEYPVRDARSLFAWFEARRQIPVAGPSRICTTIAKVERFERWAAANHPGEVIEVWIGFEAGEEARADKDPNAGKPKAMRKNRFPLMEAGFCRCRCESFVRESGYPVPRKSACVYCPYGSKTDWKTLARELPESFAKIARLEADKPPTAKNNVKLSIMGFSSKKNGDGTKTYKPTPLPIYVMKPTQAARAKPCTVCGAAQKATKATACGYLDENTTKGAAA
jgi:hypothetical protein